MKAWEARFKSATFAESALSAIEVAGKETEPAEMVRPLAPVMRPWEVTVPCVAMFPFEVVVALPFT